MSKATGFIVKRDQGYTTLLDSVGRTIWESNDFSLDAIFHEALMIGEQPGNRKALITLAGDTLLSLGPWNNIQQLAGNYTYQVWKWSNNGSGSSTSRVGMINGKGEKILPPLYKAIRDNYRASEITLIDTLDKAGLITPEGQTLLSCQCDWVTPLSLGDNRLYACKNGGLLQLYNSNQRPVLKRPTLEIKHSNLLNYVLVADQRNRFAVVGFDGKKRSRHLFVRVSMRPITPEHKAIAVRYPSKGTYCGSVGH